MISQVQTNSGILSSVMPGARMFQMVTMTLIAPMIEDTPIRCTASTKKAVESPLYLVDSGA